ncbi:MAG: hypothetical protein Q7T55_08240 [Solirubrobacteraceae bacterium]|nr:hypothetical protein [Solirubrobacteraceae bacterium]
MQAAATISSRAGRGAARGTCGELAQGVLPGGRRFHVTCPIEVGAEIAVRLTTAPRTSVVGLPDWATTTGRAVRVAAEFLELGPVLIEVERTSGLHRAKGMASSTADVIAAATAVAAAAGLELDPPTLAQLATSVEASDGVMYPGVVALDQHDGSLLHDWSWTPRFTIATFIPVEDRITAEVRFDRQASMAGEYGSLLTELDAAMHAHDAVAVGAISTRSAELNEAFVANPLLPHLRSAVTDFGAVGLCVGHSGTVCGLLFAPDSEGAAGELAREAVSRLLPTLPPGTEALVTRMAA